MALILIIIAAVFVVAFPVLRSRRPEPPMREAPEPDPVAVEREVYSRLYGRPKSGNLGPISQRADGSKPVTERGAKRPASRDRRRDGQPSTGLVSPG